MAKQEKCKHGLTQIICAYCQGHKPTEYGEKVKTNRVYKTERQFFSSRGGNIAYYRACEEAADETAGNA